MDERVVSDPNTLKRVNNDSRKDYKPYVSSCGNKGTITNHVVSKEKEGLESVSSPTTFVTGKAKESDHHPSLFGDSSCRFEEENINKNGSIVLDRFAVAYKRRQEEDQQLWTPPHTNTDPIIIDYDHKAVTTTETKSATATTSATSEYRSSVNQIDAGKLISRRILKRVMPIVIGSYSCAKYNESKTFRSYNNGSNRKSVKLNRSTGPYCVPAISSTTTVDQRHNNISTSRPIGSMLKYSDIDNSYYIRPTFLRITKNQNTYTNLTHEIQINQFDTDMPPPPPSTATTTNNDESVSSYNFIRKEGVYYEKERIESIQSERNELSSNHEYKSCENSCCCSSGDNKTRFSFNEFQTTGIRADELHETGRRNINLEVGRETCLSDAATILIDNDEIIYGGGDSRGGGNGMKEKQRYDLPHSYAGTVSEEVDTGQEIERRARFPTTTITTSTSDQGNQHSHSSEKTTTPPSSSDVTNAINMNRTSNKKSCPTVMTTGKDAETGLITEIDNDYSVLLRNKRIALVSVDSYHQNVYYKPDVIAKDIDLTQTEVKSLMYLVVGYEKYRDYSSETDGNNVISTYICKLPKHKQYTFYKQLKLMNRSCKKSGIYENRRSGGGPMNFMGPKYERILYHIKQYFNVFAILTDTVYDMTRFQNNRCTATSIIVKKYWVYHSDRNVYVPHYALMEDDYFTDYTVSAMVRTYNCSIIRFISTENTILFTNGDNLSESTSTMSKKRCTMGEKGKFPDRDLPTTDTDASNRKEYTIPLKKRRCEQLDVNNPQHKNESSTTRQVVMEGAAESGDTEQHDGESSSIPTLIVFRTNFDVLNNTLICPISFEISLS